jgi:hypothetical protein
MSLRIAGDLDGTIADMDAALQREAQRLFGPEVDLHAQLPRTESVEDVEVTIAATQDDPDPGRTDIVNAENSATRPRTARELRKLWAHATQIENFWTSLDEVEPGAVAKLASLAARHRWEILFLTQRPSSAGDIVQIQSQRWLKAHGFDLPSVFVMRGGSRGRVANALALDAVIDDRPENCLDVITDSKAKPILIWRMRRDAVPAGIVRAGIDVVYSMEEALCSLEQLMDEGARRRTFMGRLRDAIVPNRGGA